MVHGEKMLWELSGWDDESPQTCNRPSEMRWYENGKQVGKNVVDVKNTTGL